MNDEQLKQELLKAAAFMQTADSILICTGAGMGVDSGLPDFRGVEGFWNAYPALGRAGFSFERIASPSTFTSDPRLAWGFYGHRLQMYRETKPHAGFDILKKWGEQKEFGVSVMTSNVDGQFLKAGFAPEQIHEVHGSIHYLQCSKPCTHAIWSAEHFHPVINHEECRLESDLPLCPHCGALARPNILMFDDWTWNEHRQESQERLQDAWLSRVERPLIIELGAGMQIRRVRYFSERIARSKHMHLVRINPRDAQVGHQTDISLPLGALDALERLDAITESLWGAH